MTWDYRVVRKRDKGELWYAIREVFSDEEDRIWGCTEEPVAAMGESREALVKELVEYLLAAISEDETVDFDLIPQEGAVNPADLKDLDFTTKWEDIRAELLANLKGIDCAHCLHWRKRKCMARPLSVRDKDFERQNRYVVTKGTDWCARFEGAQ